eukprot:COSAG04_NODE_1235_length_7625_cov_36.004651_3_plen_92_part_00
MSVDDVVAAVIAEVDKLGLTDSTYFFCKMVMLFSIGRAARLANASSITIADSSDHGFQLGQFNSAPHLELNTQACLSLALIKALFTLLWSS